MLLTKPKEMNACFLEFYIFSLQNVICLTDNTDFLDTIDFAKLSEAAVLKAIKSFPNGPLQVPDGFWIKFCKTHILLLRMINHSFKNELFPNSHKVKICLFSKKKGMTLLHTVIDHYACLIATRRLFPKCWPSV